MADTIPATTFPPPDLDPGDWSQLEPLYRELLDRPLDTPDQIERWLADFSAISAVVAEYASRRNIAYACHTDSEQAEKAFLHYVEQIAPKLKPMFFQLQRHYLKAPAVNELIETDERYRLLTREWKADVEVYRDENVPLQTQVTKLVSAYDKTIGAMVVDFRGKSYTLQQLGRFLEETDRPTRQEAWELSANRRLQDRDTINDQFDQLLALREQMATNAGFDDFRDYTWKARGRFDYSPQDCLDFADAVAEVVVPAVERLDEQRREAMGLTTLRPWDLAVDVHGRPPLRPFDGDHPQELVDGCRAIFERLSPALAEDFATLQFGRNLDLESRKGKRAGGFQSSLEQSGEPFIFMNAAGLQRDVETMLHEGGHAFHFVWAYRREPLVFFRHAPMEFAEVASMAMEAMGADHLDVFYPANRSANGSSEADRARRAYYEGTLRVLPWIALIDSFQHWLYTNPGHSLDARRDQWLRLHDRFQSKVVDWSGYEQQRAWMWHRQLHLFHHPFYYIEYGIAQLGALQLWQRYREDRDQALAGYRNALELGGTRALPDLFAAAGLRFDFTRATLEPLTQALTDELATLPA